jgi:hypothetical protein
VIRMESATKNVPIASRTHGAKMSNFGTREGRRGRGWMSARRPSGRRCRRGGHRNTRETRGDARRDDSGGAHRRALPSACVAPRIADSFGKYEPASAHPRQIRRAPPRTRSAPSAHPSIARAR